MNKIFLLAIFCACILKYASGGVGEQASPDITGEKLDKTIIIACEKGFPKEAKTTEKFNLDNGNILYVDLLTGKYCDGEK